ncbi:MAG: alpha/beta fold hydrolase [Candidatus Omnitrophica bacterium]|nr:alpha/beta fold hydrolase [Candidatus Omnitrophota bacterium]
MILISILWIASIVFFFIFAILLVRAFHARRMDDLEDWHRRPVKSEYRAPLPFIKDLFEDFLEAEERVFQELDKYRIQDPELLKRFKYSRFACTGPNNPCGFDTNWNRTQELIPESQPKGSILLLHGLTDSPYSVRSVAENLHSKGFHVLCLRLPGHGTVPAGLLSVSFRDWTHVVENAVAYLTDKVGENLPFYIGGYSNGGALALNYTLNTLITGNGRTPDKIVLFSPAVAITSLARVASWHRFLSWVPYFEKNKWLRIEPEFDPYKYNSTPQNAAAQTWFLTVGLRSKLHLAAKRGYLEKFPPLLTFQSVVDATINERAIPSLLYDNLPTNGSELVLFDINNLATLEGLFTRGYRNAIQHFERREDLPYTWTVVTNESDVSRGVVARTTLPKSCQITSTPLDLEWPRQVYSLAHVSVPFPPDDPIYGRVLDPKGDPRMRLGNLAFRGEMGVLSVKSDQLMRLRYNPFHEFMVRRIGEWL